MMKYCTKCGAKLVDGAKFCTVCGNSVGTSVPAENVQAIPVMRDPAPYESPAVKVKKKTRWGILAVIIAAVAVLAVAAVLLVPGFFMNAPKKFVEMHRSIISPVVDITAKSLTGELRSALPEKAGTLSAIDTDMTVSAEIETGDGMVDKIIKESSIILKVNQSDAERPLLGFLLNLSGSDILSGTIVAEKDKIGIYLPELSDDYYQIRFEDLDGILSSLGIDSEVDFEDLLSSVNNKKSPLGVDSGELTSIIESYLDIFFSMVNKENTISSKENVRLPGCGETIRCTVITFQPSADDVTEMVKQFCDKLKEDEELREIVKNLAEYVYIANPTFARQYASSDDYAEYVLESYDDSVQNLWTDNKEEIRSFAEDLEKREVCWKIAYKGMRIHTISIADEDDNGIAYESVGNILERRTDMLVRYEDGNSETFAESELKVKGKTAEGEIRVYQIEDDTAVYEFSADLAKKSGLNIPYGEYSFKYGKNKLYMNVGSEETGSVHDFKLRTENNTLKFRILSTDKPSTVTEPDGPATRVTSQNVKGILMGIYGKLSEIAMNLF